MISSLAPSCSVVVAVVAVVLFLSGCTEPASIHASADDVTTSPASIRASVDKVRSSLESIPYARVHMHFVNTSERTVRVTQYRVLWPGGSKLLEPDELVIAPRAEQQRSARVFYSDGNLKVLLKKPQKVRIEVLEVRGL